MNDTPPELYAFGIPVRTDRRIPPGTVALLNTRTGRGYLTATPSTTVRAILGAAAAINAVPILRDILSPPERSDQCADSSPPSSAP